MSEKYTLPSKEFIQSEEDLLLQIQAQQAEQLKNTGILDKVISAAKLDDYEGPIFAHVVRGTKMSEDGERFDAAGVQLNMRRINAYGNEQVFTKTVGIGMPYDGLVLTGDDFTVDDFEIVDDMLKGLKEAREMGVLSRLDSSFGRIASPYRMISRQQELPPTDSD